MSEQKNEGPCPVCGYQLSTADVRPYQLHPGTILRGAYVVGKALGQGGFGITYLGWDINLETRVAIKEYFPSGVVSRSTANSPVVVGISENRDAVFQKGREKFVKEARILAKLSSDPRIVQVKDFFQENNTAYFVMEYLEGVNLEEYVRQKGGRLSVEETFQLIEPMFGVLGGVHEEGLVHRDVSPDNIMLTAGRELKLLDFGAADEGGGGSKTVLLKYGYTPSEQYSRHGNLGPWTDIYALCATIYFCLTGEPPQDALERRKNDRLQEKLEGVEGLSAKRCQALVKGMSVRYEDRYQTMEELRMALQPSDGVHQEKKEKKKEEKEERKGVPLKWILTVAGAFLILLLGMKACSADGSEEVPESTGSDSFSVPEETGTAGMDSFPVSEGTETAGTDTFPVSEGTETVGTDTFPVSEGTETVGTGTLPAQVPEESPFELNPLEVNFYGNAQANMNQFYDGRLAKMNGDEGIYFFADYNGALNKIVIGNNSREKIYQGTYNGRTNSIKDINVDQIGKEFLYFDNGVGEIERLNLNTLEVQEIAVGEDPRLIGNRLYYHRPNKTSWDVDIYYLDTDTLEEVLLYSTNFDFIYDFSVSAEYVFFTMVGSVYRLSPDGSLTVLYGGRESRINNMMLTAGRLYLGTSGEIISIDYEGNELARLQVDQNFNLLFAEDDCLYLEEMVDYGISQIVRYRMDSGEEPETIILPTKSEGFSYLNKVDDIILIEIEDIGMTSLYYISADDREMELSDAALINIWGGL